MRLLPRGRRTLPVRPPARDFLGDASVESRRLGHDYVGSEHVLLALADHRDGRAAAVLRHLGVTADDVRADILAVVGEGFGAPTARIDRDALAALGIDLDEVRRRIEATFGKGALERTSAACTPVCPRAKQALQRASEDASGPLVTDEDVLAGLVSVADSVAARILASRGVTPERLRSALQS
jgi:ATP-dependent Clp protease ATP-binding subunit ClpA